MNLDHIDYLLSHYMHVLFFFGIHEKFFVAFLMLSDFGILQKLRAFYS